MRSGASVSQLLAESLGAARRADHGGRCRCGWGRWRRRMAIAPRSRRVKRESRSDACRNRGPPDAPRSRRVPRIARGGLLRPSACRRSWHAARRAASDLPGAGDEPSERAAMSGRAYAGRPRDAATRSRAGAPARAPAARSSAAARGSRSPGAASSSIPITLAAFTAIGRSRRAPWAPPSRRGPPGWRRSGSSRRWPDRRAACSRRRAPPPSPAGS